MYIIQGPEGSEGPEGPKGPGPPEHLKSKALQVGSALNIARCIVNSICQMTGKLESYCNPQIINKQQD